MRLIINGQDIELAPNVMIARTLQVNDIGSPQTRQASYTNTFNIPRTASNTKVFDMLGIIGNNSNIPYQKNEAYLYDESGFCLVYKGWAVISETAKDFKCNIYDGIIDFYKSIDNKTLADLDLSALAHDKTVAEVKSTQNLSKPYVYILADYNGKAIYDSKINTDFLVPSVKVPFLWEKIEQFTGYQLNGSFKTNPDFINLFLTYPKGVPPTLGADIYTNTSIDRDVITADYSNRIVFPLLQLYSFINSAKLDVTTDSKSIIALVPIQIKVTFVINPNFTAFQGGVEYNPIASFNGSTFVCDGTSRTISFLYTLGQNETLSFPFEFLLTPDQTEFNVSVPDFFTSASIQELTNAVLFEEEFAGMSIKQFVSEIFWRFNLTMFKNPYENSYTLKYLSEIVNASSIDWSDKFDSLDSENYIYGDFGQRSWLRHRYNDENSFFNDGYFDINNTNLPDSKSVISSVAYSPEFNQTQNIGFSTNLYKFWDKEAKEGGIVNYKTLANRFYFLKSAEITLTGTSLTSEVLNQTDTITTAQREIFAGLSFKSIVDAYYSEMAFLLNQSKIFNVTLRLTEIDIVNMDFSKPVYIEQLGGSFLVNKISNFIPFKDTKVELIKISK
jgi:hypothetical protein